jgi:hypothetical protein
VLTRRELLLLLAASACSRSERAPVVTSAAPSAVRPAPKASCEGGELVTWDFDGVASRVAILKPKGASGRFPVLVALHGHGEAIKGPDRGCLGWPNDYALVRALERVCAPPLTREDFEGLVTDAHLAEINGELAKRPWSGLVVVCPYLPDLDLRKDDAIRDYGAFVAQTILPRVAREMPARAGAASTGIDGVSLGGAVALRAGLAMPETFGAVGALQPAIDEGQVADIVALARKRSPAPLRITTSEDDYYKKPVHALDDALRAASVAHDFAELPGPHDYIFNRGAGAYEMLMWHARVLA